MRIIYFDESGSSTDQKTEPIIVVAAVIVHGDLQSGHIERDAEQIVNDLVPERLREGFEFHGKELLSGSNRLKGWPREERLKAWGQFLNLVSKYDLPVRYGALNKAGFWTFVDRISRDLTRESEPTVEHETAFLWCAEYVENWFLSHANRERGLCIADDTKLRGLLKTNFRDYRKHPEILESMRFNHLIDTIYFGDSRESVFLQLADVCAFVIRRTLMNKDDVLKLYSIIDKHVQPKPLAARFQSFRWG